MAGHCGHETAHADCAPCRQSFSKAVLVWAASGSRAFPWRKGRDPYRIALAEVLLQQTRAENVSTIFGDIVKAYPGWHQLAEATVRELEATIKPLGLQKRRAAALSALAKEVTLRGGLPSTSRELATLPGVGQYISRAIATQISGERCAAVDVNIARVLERVFGPRKLADIRYDPYLQTLAASLFEEADSDRYLLALLDFAAVTCKALRPACDTCPVSSCQTRKAVLDTDTGGDRDAI